MEIRPAEASDFTLWMPLWRAYQGFYKVEVPESVTEQTWRRFLDDSEPMHCAVAEEGDGLIGIVHYIFHRSCWTRGDYVYLQDLFTKPESRRRGVAKALIQHVYDAAARAGAGRVWWLTHESNAEAMGLYDQVAERSGFLQYRKILGS